MDVTAVRSFTATFVTDTTNPPAPRPRWLRRGRFDLVEIADAITALICFAIANSVLTTDNAHYGHQPTGLIVLLAFLTCAPLALRTRFPLAAWGASALAVIVTSLVIPPSVLLGGYLYATYGVHVAYGIAAFTIVIGGLMLLPIPYHLFQIPHPRPRRVQWARGTRAAVPGPHR